MSLTDIIPGSQSFGDTVNNCNLNPINMVVSARNACDFCCNSHGAAAAHCAGGSQALVDAARADYRTAPLSAKLKALLPVEIAALWPTRPDMIDAASEHIESVD